MKTLTKILMSTAAVALTAVSVKAQYVGAACGCPPLASRTQVSVSSLLDGSDNFTTNQVWDCANTYILDQTGPAYVTNGLTLTIGPGTVIKGEDGVGADASSLVISRGSKIFASGTQDCKIVFTTVNDVNVNGSYAVTNTAQWGGLIILGRAQNNLINTNSLATGDGEGRIEGLVASDDRNRYGVNDGTPNGVFTGTFINDDNSGIVRHVSLRHGGAVIGAANEVNGITLGSVGNGTILENIEVVSNEDDAIEFFGGTANLRYFSGLFCQDDYVDVDQAYTGNIQYVFALQSSLTTGGGGILGDHILELDGEDGNINAVLQGSPRIFNVTGIGNGVAGDPLVEMKERFQGTVANSIFVNSGIGARFSADAEQNFTVSETLEFYNNSFDAVSASLFLPATVGTLFTANQNIVEAGVLPDFSFVPTSPTDVVGAVPAVGSAGNASNAVYPGIDPVNYRGAFEPGQEPWITGGFLDTAFDGIGNLPNNCRSDLNGDGLINASDFGVFGADFVAGTCN